MDDDQKYGERYIPYEYMCCSRLVGKAILVRLLFVDNKKKMKSSHALI